MTLISQNGRAKTSITCSRWLSAIVLGILTLQPERVDAQVLSVENCETEFIASNGVRHLYRGRVTIEYMTSQDTHLVRGVFHDQLGNRADFEVATNQAQGGVGGLWFNHAAHRGMHIELRRVAGGYVLTDYEDTGQTVLLSCRRVR